MGLHSSDTAELFFEDCRVPAGNLGRERRWLCAHDAQPAAGETWWERLVPFSGAHRMLEITIDYCKTRTVFGRPISRHQHNAFKIVEMATEIEMAKDFTSPLGAGPPGTEGYHQEGFHGEVVQRRAGHRVAYHCVQLHGAYGYMDEYEICRDAVARPHGSIAAGTTEVMKTIVARMMGL